MNAWSHLPNAHHIDWLLRTLREFSELWNTDGITARRKIRDMAHLAAYETGRDADRGAAYEAAWDAAWIAAWHLIHNEFWNPAGDAIIALVAYDDCDQYLQMTYEKLKMYALLSEKPPAILLLPMVYVMENSNECLVTSY